MVEKQAERIHRRITSVSSLQCWFKSRMTSGLIKTDRRYENVILLYLRHLKMREKR